MIAAHFHAFAGCRMRYGAELAAATVAVVTTLWMCKSLYLE